MDEIQKKFCKSLKRHKEEHYSYRGGVNDLAKKLKVSQSHLSNVLYGRKCPGEPWRRFVAFKIGMDYDAMIGIEKTEKNKVPFKNTDKKKPKVVSIDPSVELLNECIQEAGVDDYLNDKQKQALLKIIKDELKSAEEKAKTDIKKYLNVLRG